MIENFFRSLRDRKVNYLLISGQATVLYGAATFSEDIDLWVAPDQENLDRLRQALHQISACWYKLTPPLEEKFAREGHGFHFILPGEPEIYLDVMGAPPRSPEFETALKSANNIDTDWGCLPVVGIEHLVEIKKTQRMEDYPVISKLALLASEHAQVDQAWVRDNIFTLETLQSWYSFLNNTETSDILSSDENLYRLQLLDQAAFDESLEIRMATELSGKIQACQQEDRKYWRSIIQSLKALRSSGDLMPANEPV